jgi:prepilin-type N-terminal cleavage/methylation domain-containing protein
MNWRRTRDSGNYAATGRRRGFTLIELLVVVAIITMLIGILLPTLSAARDKAKNVKTRAALKSYGEALEMYRNDNETDESARITNGYPPSAMAPDLTETDTPDLPGACWLVRHLMGKDMKGYASPRAAGNLPPTEWYGFNGNTPKVERVGPYLESAKVVRVKDLPQSPNNPQATWGNAREQQVLVDTFGYPVLYYVANPAQARWTRANIATYGASDQDEPGIYNFQDNALFTGQCLGTSTGGGGGCPMVSWHFQGDDPHFIEFFGSNPPDRTLIINEVGTFPYYILHKKLYESTLDPGAPQDVTTVPHRKDSFLLITAGKDGIFGSSDDVKNF